MPEPYEEDRESNAVGQEDLTPCPKCGGDQHKPCTCEAEFTPLRQRSEDEFAKAVADGHFEALLEDYARTDAARRAIAASNANSKMLMDAIFKILPQ